MAKKLSVKNPYKTLLKCKKPVLILVERFDVDNEEYNRVRIFNPINKKCTYMHYTNTRDFERSCFNEYNNSKTITKMKKWDKGWLKIVEIIEL